ncbi:sulfotransferase family protein [Novosphingobium beihaiensis]|uniref:Sulfotransferase domain-containing protein n=1 Tax=Novosphingobium beihaiensis TaxID=2930389 RepID=A0ABT0BK95_9SPHN|nr:hypothetical protein [Novosphingobium beihaiensis]MCJ2185393.1 hypothetical protein [Novosphingobium beihaiensis]
MRLLVHGMQSSGATTFTQVLAQRPGCIALVDIPNNFAAPRVTTRKDFVAKAVITTAYPLAVHVERFRPDRVVLFLRDPRDNYVSLSTKPYRHHSGLMEEKFRLLEQLFAQSDRFDAIIHYEDLVARKPCVSVAMEALGWPVREEHFRFRRSCDELLRSLWEAEPSLIAEMDAAFGAARGDRMSGRYRRENRNKDSEGKVAQLCPGLLAHYRIRELSRGEDMDAGA